MREARHKSYQYIFVSLESENIVLRKQALNQGTSFKWDTRALWGQIRERISK